MRRGDELEYVYYIISKKKISREIQVPWAKDRKTWLPSRQKQKKAKVREKTDVLAVSFFFFMST